MYDPGLKYELSVALGEPCTREQLRDARERLVRDLADYPGVMVWREELYGGMRVITAVKYPEAIARVVIERMRRDALRGRGEAA